MIGLGLGIHRKRRSSTTPVIPVLVSAETAPYSTTDIYLTFDQTMDESIIPDWSCFTIKCNGNVVELPNVEYYMQNLDLYLSTGNFAYSDIITISYTAPEINPLQGVDGGLVASFVDYPVTNNIAWPALAPSDLSLVVDSDTQITATWVNNDTFGDGTELEISTDNFATVDDTITNALGVTSEVITGLTAGTLYYFKVRAYVGAVHSEYSGAVSAVTTIVTLLSDGNTVAWYSSDNAGSITVDDSIHISQINDILESGHNLLSTLTNRPILTSTGIIFDGVSHFMKTANFTFDQPEFVYLVIKPLAWTLWKVILDGSAINTMQIIQNPTKPQVGFYSGETIQITDVPLGKWVIMRVLFSGINGKVIINNNTPVTGNIGTVNAGGISLGARADKNPSFANFALKETIFRKSVAGESDIYNYLESKYRGILGTSVTYVLAGYYTNVPGKMYIAKSDGGMVFYDFTNPYTSGYSKLVCPNIMYKDGYYYVSYIPIQTADDISTKLIIIKSNDLITWVNVVEIDFNGGAAGIEGLEDSCWFIEEGIIHLIFGASLSNVQWQSDWQIYEIHATNSGLTTWSDPVKITQTGLNNNIIDPTVCKIGSYYYMFVKDEDTDKIRLFRSLSLIENWSEYTDCTSLIDSLVSLPGGVDNKYGEGPFLLKIEGGWRLYIDSYAAASPLHQCYVESYDDFVTFTKPVVCDYDNDIWHMSIIEQGVNTQHCF
jgi:hypothetical protein